MNGNIFLKMCGDPWPIPSLWTLACYGPTNE